MGKLTAKQVAERLGVTVRRVNAMIQAGQLPAEKFASVHMIDEKDLRLVADRKVGRPAKRRKHEKQA